AADSRPLPLTASRTVHSHPYEVVHVHLYADIGQVLSGFNEVKAFVRQAGLRAVRQPHQRVSVPVFQEDDEC
ncbi:hypothetical protein ABZZ74_53870, partial [Streptomyces sp. NPDC006476]|uniref:hypothetical protein n=1 Tax=Streptomyces sp. NPDC006476 TaxID=3157175 RepID=UPI0033A4FF3C